MRARRVAALTFVTSLIVGTALIAPPAMAKKNHRPKVGAIHAVFEQARFATTYSVEASDPDGDRLLYEWRLAPPPNDPTCANMRIGPLKSVATWFHGDQHGCTASHQDASPVGHPGTVYLAVSDGKIRCETSYFGTVTGESKRTVSCGRAEGIGQPSAGLVAELRSIGRDLDRLAADVNAGKLDDEKQRGLRIDAITTKLDAAMAEFPPVWGCPFANVFGPLVAADNSLTEQIDDPVPPYPWLSYGALFLAYAADRLGDRDCTVPAATRTAMRSLADRAEALDADADAGKVTGPALVERMRQLEHDKHVILDDDFQDVWASKYLDLVRWTSTIHVQSIQAHSNSDHAASVAAVRAMQAAAQKIESDLRDARD